ncbi:MAG: hypothetical protein AAF530_23665 [Pseudomonadota bacterium]
MAQDARHNAGATQGSLRAPRYPRVRSRIIGLTLLELLVVVAILAATATIGVLALDNTGQVTQERLVTHEMRELAKAIQNFRQDTGFYPKTGPFAAAQVALPGDIGLLNSPANMVQLFREPVDGDDNPIMPWNPDSGRGWRGPYSSDFGEGNVIVGEGFVDASDTDPLAGDAITVIGVADPFEFASEFIWARPFEIPTADDVDDAPTLRGSPYLLFLENDQATEIERCQAPCLVSLGPDGVYDQGAADTDDIILNLTPSL